MGWDEFGVEAYAEFTAFDEKVDWDRRGGDVFGRVGHTFGVFLGAEESDFTGGGRRRVVSESFEAFEGLNTVVEPWCHAVYGQERG